MPPIKIPIQDQAMITQAEGLKWVLEKVAARVGGSYYGSLTIHIENGVIVRVVDSQSHKPPYFDNRGG